MTTKKSVSGLKESDLKGMRVFVRVDLNVPLDDNFKITDDTLIRAAVPTIKSKQGQFTVHDIQLGDSKKETLWAEFKTREKPIDNQSCCLEKQTFHVYKNHQPLTPLGLSIIFTSITPSQSQSLEFKKMAAKKSVSSLKEADLKGKRVFVRVDLNVPLDDSFKITDDTRIRAAVPTIKYLMSNGARVILSSHLGRPKGVTPKFSLKPLVPRISELLGIEVKMADDCIGPDVEKLVAEIPEGGVLLLENVRFYKEEEKNDPEFAKKLASLADLYVNDAFGTAHRAHASTEGVAKYLKPSVAGFLMQKELDYLVGAVSNPKKPFAAIVGGSKVSSKIGVIESLLNEVDVLILGGGMIFTFYKAQGLAVGSSLVEEDKLDLATSLLEKAKAKGVSLLLPSDVVIADKFAPDANSKIVPASSIPDGWMGLDIGPDSIKSFSESLDTTKTVIWNGPMGVFEFKKFAAGTEFSDGIRTYSSSVKKKV
nr:phosphoglycerate kinase, cytosolic [Tanacetum cinerariifolium]